MFGNKEIEELANSVICFCENRLKLDNNLTVKNKDIFRRTIYKIKKLMRD